MAKAFVELVYGTKTALTTAATAALHKEIRFGPCPIPLQNGAMQSSALGTDGSNNEQNSRLLSTA